MKKDLRTVRFLPIHDKTVIDFGDMEHPTGMGYVQGFVKVIGFKPGPARKREGWLVVLVTGKNRPTIKKLSKSRSG
jgi:hypothetical protein